SAGGRNGVAFSCVGLLSNPQCSSSAWKVLRSTILGAPSSSLMMSFIVLSVSLLVCGCGRTEFRSPGHRNSLNRWQTPHILDLAKSRKHARVFFCNCVPFSYTLKLD